MAAREPALVALNREWQALLPGSSARVEAWALAEPALAGATGLAGVLDMIRDRPDAVLAALLRLGADDPLAHRVVLQTMLGKLVLICGGRPGMLPEAVSELWLAVVEYPVARRPRSIAANLAWTVRRRLHPAPAPAMPLPEPPPEPEAAAVLAEALRLGLIDESTHRTLWTVYVAGLTSGQAGAVLGATPEAIRWRCSHALRRLARNAELLSA